MEPPFLPKRRPARGGRRARRRLVVTAKGICMAGVGGLLFVWLAMAGLRPFILDWEQREEIRRLEAEVASVDQGNGDLRRRIRVLNTDAGIEREARGLGMVRPGEELIQTSDAPPPTPPEVGRGRGGQLPTPPPLSAVSRPEDRLGHAWHMASRSLVRWMRARAAPGDHP